MECLFDPTKPQFAAWVWLHDVDQDWIEPMSSIHPMQPEAAPLYYASLCGFRGLVEHLIASHSSDVNCSGGSHTTALHAASVKGHFEVVSLLLENGADPNSRDHLVRAPLHRVSQGGQLVMVRSSLEIARPLVDSGADVNVTDYQGWTPLQRQHEMGIVTLRSCYYSDLARVSKFEMMTKRHHCTGRIVKGSSTSYASL